MFNFKDVNILKFFAAFSFIVMLAACSSSNDGTVFDPIVFDPDVAPQNVQVVSGGDNTGTVQNTISWTLDPAATDYVVYVQNTPGVTTSSSVVSPTVGFNYDTHSGVDVVAGTPLYYRVQALSGGESSILSAEVTGTPQESITTINALNDVAWNGTDTLVAVGAAGVILSSPNGVTGAWNDVSDVNTTPEALSGVTWDTNSQFLIVGAGLTVLSGDGSIGGTWSRQDLSNLAVTNATDLEDVAWLGDQWTGDQYIAVGKNGTIITSDDGSVWTEQDSGLGVTGITLNGVASDGNIIVAVGTSGTILTSTDGVTWSEDINGNNILNDVTWDGNQFGIVGSDDTILTSTDGLTWTPQTPGTPDINFVAASQWDSSLPINPILGAVGSDGTFAVSPDAVTGFRIPTGTNKQLSGMTWVDDGVTPAYFVMVGTDGTVLTSQLQ